MGRAAAEPGGNEVEPEPSPMVVRLLKLGTWTAWRLRLPKKRYVIPIRVRARDQDRGRGACAAFFPGGFALMPPSVGAPSRPRGRPRKTGTPPAAGADDAPGARSLRPRPDGVGNAVREQSRPPAGPAGGVEPVELDPRAPP